MKKALVCFTIILPALILAQVTEEWVARYNGPEGSFDYARAIALDDEGNVYVTGNSRGPGCGNYDYATIKYNSQGQELWVARYDGPVGRADIAYAIAVDGSGNVYVTGYSVSSEVEEAEEDDDYATIKYNSSGVQQWVARYDGPGNGADEAKAIALDDAGNVYVTGVSKGSEVEGDCDYVTIKYNSSGEEQWVARYGGPGNGTDQAYDIALDGEGNVYVTGSSEGLGDSDYATVKYNSSGVQLWVARYETGMNTARAISVDDSGNVYVTGSSLRIIGRVDYATVKYNSSGQEQWLARYSGPADDIDGANAIAVDGEGNVYVTGQSKGSEVEGNYDYATVKYNSSGEEQWVARYDVSYFADKANAIALDGSGNVYVTGESYGLLYLVGGSLDYVTIKYSRSGVERWLARYDGPSGSTDRAKAIALDGEGNVYVTGWSEGSGTLTDYATIKYKQVIIRHPFRLSVHLGGTYWNQSIAAERIEADFRWGLPWEWRFPWKDINPWEIEAKLGYIFLPEEISAENRYVFDATLDLRYKILAGKRFSPFVGVGPGYYRLGYTNANEFGLNGCAGIGFNLTRRLSLEVCGTVHCLFDEDNTWFPQTTVGFLYGL